jgi:hypothetical protein
MTARRRDGRRGTSVPGWLDVCLIRNGCRLTSFHEAGAAYHRVVAGAAMRIEEVPPNDWADALNDFTIAHEGWLSRWPRLPPMKRHARTSGICHSSECRRFEPPTATLRFRSHVLRRSTSHVSLNERTRLPPTWHHGSTASVIVDSRRYSNGSERQGSSRSETGVADGAFMTRRSNMERIRIEQHTWTARYGRRLVLYDRFLHLTFWKPCSPSWSGPTTSVWRSARWPRTRLQRGRRGRRQGSPARFSKNPSTKGSRASTTRVIARADRRDGIRAKTCRHANRRVDPDRRGGSQAMTFSPLRRIAPAPRKPMPVTT